MAHTFYLDNNYHTVSVNSMKIGFTGIRALLGCTCNIFKTKILMECTLLFM